MILESIVTTVSSDGRVNVAPMGPWVNRELSQFTLKPFQPSTTYDNLRSTRRATVHVTDDVLLVARCVTHSLTDLPEGTWLTQGEWYVLQNCCRYFALEVIRWDDDPTRATASCRVIDQGNLRPFWGWNRAKHTVLEAAILATRLRWIPKEEIQLKLEAYSEIVAKTAGDEESQAFAMIRDYVNRARVEPL